jgi:hypothetical protein
MPTVSIFLGITIRIYHSDHPPPHFHAAYGDQEAVIEIRTGRVLWGRLPARVKRLVEEWRRIRLRPLQAAWNDAEAFKMPRRIKPLE